MKRVRYWGWNKQLREQGFATLRDREKKGRDKENDRLRQCNRGNERVKMKGRNRLREWSKQMREWHCLVH